MEDLRRATLTDLPAIMRIIAEAQAFLKNLNVNQWQNGYPSEDIIRQDIEKNNGYILTVAEEIAAFATVVFSEEPTYSVIYDGEWLNDNEYAVIHRLAVSGKHKGKGVGSHLFREIEKMTLARQISDIRIDTHEDNLPMQQLIRKSGYNYCGVIYLADGSKRIAFQWESLM